MSVWLNLTSASNFHLSLNSQLLVYGVGYVIPSSLKVLQPDMEFSLMVAISTDVQYGRLVLVMDKNFCTDTAGNSFTRTSNSSFFLHFGKDSFLCRTELDLFSFQKSLM